MAWGRIAFLGRRVAELGGGQEVARELGGHHPGVRDGPGISECLVHAQRGERPLAGLGRASQVPGPQSQSPEEEGNRLPIEPGEFSELDNVNPTLARLAFRDEGLRPVQGSSDFHLRQPGLAARLLKALEELPVARGV